MHVMMHSSHEHPSSTRASADHGRSGLFLVVLGVDGSGKSTLLDRAQERLAPHFPAIQRFHWRARILPRLSGTTGRNIRLDIPQQPPKDFAYGRALSLLRFGYHYVDFLLGYWFVIRPARARGHLVVVERWYLDTIVNPVRYGFDLPEWLLRIGGRLMPKPDLTILLEAPAEAIHARKPELSVEELNNQFQKMRAVLPHSGCCISTAGSIDRSVSELVSAVLAAAHRRFASATGAVIERCDRWRAFPKTGDTKLWIHARDRIASALHLYHPYSWIGMAVIRVVPYLPRRLSTRRMKLADELQLERLAGAIRRMLGHDNLIISFSTGTPGAHRKITAQVSRDGTIIAYVKIGSSQAAKKLIEAEALALSRLDPTTFSSIMSVPRVLARSTSDDYLLLALSAPPIPGRQRAVTLDEHDIRILTSLVPPQPRVESLARVLDTIGFGEIHAGMRDAYPDFIAHACEAAATLLDRVGVRMGPAHGDYAPWNTLVLNDGSLYVFDWEHAAEAPLLSDLFHRVFMPNRLVNSGIPPHVVISRLLALMTMPLTRPLLEKSGIEPKQFPAYLILYFLQLAKRESHENAGITAYLQECIHLLLVFAEHPAHRPRVLVSAYACEPHKGSEPGVGWGWVQEIARDHDTWVITRANNREVVVAELRANPNPHLHVAYVDLPGWARFWKRKQRGIRTYYYLWQFAAWRCARKLNREVHFDLAHHVTFVNDWLWTFLALMPLPYVWGPIGSNARCPSGLLPHSRARRADLLRITIQNCVRWLDPLWWLSAVRAAEIIAINQNVADMLPLSGIAAHKIRVEPAVAVENMQAMSMMQPRDGTRILYVGRHLAVKGGALAVESFAKVASQHSGTRLIMIGEGPEENDLRGRVQHHGIQDRVDFLPWQPQDQVWRAMEVADIFLFPSMEGAGMAVLEAMRAGLPIVCLNFGGPGTMVTEENGCRVSVGPFDQVVDGLAAELIKLLDNPVRRVQFGEAARRRVQSAFSWEAKRIAVRRLYRDVMFSRSQLTQDSSSYANSHNRI